MPTIYDQQTDRSTGENEVVNESSSAAIVWILVALVVCALAGWAIFGTYSQSGKSSMNDPRPGSISSPSHSSLGNGAPSNARSDSLGLPAAR